MTPPPPIVSPKSHPADDTRTSLGTALPTALQLPQAPQDNLLVVNLVHDGVVAAEPPPILLAQEPSPPGLELFEPPFCRPQARDAHPDPTRHAEWRLRLRADGKALRLLALLAVLRLRWDRRIRHHRPDIRRDPGQLRARQGVEQSDVRGDLQERGREVPLPQVRHGVVVRGVGRQCQYIVLFFFFVVRVCRRPRFVAFTPLIGGGC